MYLYETTRLKAAKRDIMVSVGVCVCVNENPLKREACEEKEGRRVCVTGSTGDFTPPSVLCMWERIQMLEKLHG